MVAARRTAAEQGLLVGGPNVVGLETVWEKRRVARMTDGLRRAGLDIPAE